MLRSQLQLRLPLQIFLRHLVSQPPSHRPRRKLISLLGSAVCQIPALPHRLLSQRLLPLSDNLPVNPALPHLVSRQCNQSQALEVFLMTCLDRQSLPLSHRLQTWTSSAGNHSFHFLQQPSHDCSLSSQPLQATNVAPAVQPAKPANFLAFGHGAGLFAETPAQPVQAQVPKVRSAHPLIEAHFL